MTREHEDQGLMRAIRDRLDRAREALIKRSDAGDGAAAMSLSIVDRCSRDKLAALVVSSLRAAADETIEAPAYRSAVCARAAAYYPLSLATPRDGAERLALGSALLALAASEREGPVSWCARCSSSRIAPTRAGVRCEDCHHDGPRGGSPVEWLDVNGYRVAYRPDEPWPEDAKPREAIAAALDALGGERERWLARFVRAGLVRSTGHGVTWPDAPSDPAIPEGARRALEANPLPLIVLARAWSEVDLDRRAELAVLPTSKEARDAIRIVSGRDPAARHIAGERPGTGEIIPRGFFEIDLPALDNRGVQCLLPWAEAEEGRANLPATRDPGLVTTTVRRILAADREHGVRDWLTLLVMADEQGRTGRFVWTWELHREIAAAHDRRITQGNVTEAAARAAVVARLRRWEAAKVTFNKPRANGKTDWIKVAHGLLSLDGGTNADDGSLERAVITLWEPLYESARPDASKPHYASFPREILSLDGPAVRLAAMVTAKASDERKNDGALLLKASTLWDYGAVEGRDDETKDKHLAAALDAIQRAHGIASWSREPGKASPERRYQITQTAAWIDRVVHGVAPISRAYVLSGKAMPLALPASPGAAAAAVLPGVEAIRTGGDLRAWREAQGLTQAAAAVAIGVSPRTLVRAEKEGEKRLSSQLSRALTCYRKGHVGPSR